LQKSRFAEIVLLLAASLIFFHGCATTRVKAHPEQGAESPYLKTIMARIYEDNGDIDKALKLYKELNNPYAWLSAARIYTALSDYTNALVYLNMVLASGEYTDEALEQMVNIYVQTNSIDKALAEVESYSKMHPDNARIKLLLAKLKLFTSDPKGAKAILDQLPQDGDDIEIQYLISKTCIELKDSPCAIKALEKVIELAPEFPQAYIDLGRIYESEGFIDEAITIYSKLLDADPESREARIALADLYILSGKNRQAIEQLKAFAEVYPNKEITRKLIILEIDTGMYDDAIELLKSIKDPAPEDQYFMAIAYAGKKDYQSALNTLDQLTSSGQLECDAAVLKSSVLDEMNNKQEAFNTLNAIWKKYSKDNSCREAGYRLATMLEEKGQTDEGLKIALSILEANPNDAIMLNFVGYIWADKGINLDKARKMVSDALTSRPDDGYILDSMAWVMFKSGRTKDALPYIEKALAKYPDEPVINEHMGDIQAKLGNNKLALKHYLKAKEYAKKGASPQLAKKIETIMKKSRKPRS